MRHWNFDKKTPNIAAFARDVGGSCLQFPTGIWRGKCCDFQQPSMLAVVILFAATAFFIAARAARLALAIRNIG